MSPFRSVRHLPTRVATPWTLALCLVVFVSALSAFNVGWRAHRCLLEIEAQQDGVSRFRVYWAKGSKKFKAKHSEAALLSSSRPRQLLWLGNLKSIDRLRIVPLADRAGRIHIKKLALRQPGWEPIVLIPGREGALVPRHLVRRLERTADGLRIETGGPNAQLELQFTKTRNLASWGRFLFLDLQVQGLWLAVGLALLFLAPGVAWSAWWFPAGRISDTQRLITLFPLSLCFFFSLYLLFEIVSALGGNGAPVIAGLGPAALLVLIGLAVRRGRQEQTPSVILSTAPAIAMLLAIVALAAFIVSAGVAQPLEVVTHRTISGELTFGAFGAHDNLFQYVNGKAIADRVPFSDFYGGRALIYQVQDREVLPGVIYAVQRLLLKPFFPALADSFFIYTLFGTCLNAMVVLPLLALSRRYDPQGRPGLRIGLISLNAFVFSNYYFTWFKLAGAALFLCALALLLEDDSRWRRWAAAGILLGLATTMHAGNALGIPLFLIWLVWRHWRRWSRWRNTLLAAGTLCVLFIAMNLPWAVVKHIHFPDNQSLLKEHFLAGHSHPDGLWASAREFLDAEPLPRQLPRRWAQLTAALRITELTHLAGFLKTGEWHDFFFFWNKYEWKYPALSLWPLCVLLAVDGLIRRLCRRRDIDELDHGAERGPEPVNLPATAADPSRQEGCLPCERRTAGALALAALAAVIFAKSAGEPADFMQSLPLGPFLLLMLILICAALRMTPALRWLYGAWMLVAAGRLAWGVVI
jgi:hypothetical protein